MVMNSGAKMLIFIGGILILAGILWGVAGRFIPFGRLPGDIAVEKENFRFYFPLATCLLLSIALTLILNLLGRLLGK